VTHKEYPVPVSPTHTLARTEVELLADLGRWRRELFRHLRLHNPARSAAQVDDAVQRLLERLVFIRACEDRGIEERRLLPMLRQEDLAAQLNTLFREFEHVYGGRLFAPHLCEELTGEAAAYERVIEGLYQAPGGCGLYDFSAIDADVLGMVYEQYLGSQVRDPGGRQAAEKRVKRKARGIYYTPQPVVRYIVAQTVGRLLRERTGEQVRQVKVLDMACGSGSFLIEAFDVLDRYSPSPEEVGFSVPPSPQPSPPLWAALPSEREGAAAPSPRRGEGRVRGEPHDIARISKHTLALYGVDLDPHAVEIAQLNLLLRALDRRGRLPRSQNVRQGDSLVSGTPAELEEAFGPTWRERHAFNWEEEFPQVFTSPGGGAAGGFDAIVGNPPYVSFGLRGSARAEEAVDRYLRDKYPASAEYKLSTYAIFVNRGISLLSEGGYLGFILPDSFLLGRYFSKLRRYILDTCTIQEIILFARDAWRSGSVGLPVVLIVQKVGDKASREASTVTVKLCRSPDQLAEGKFEKVYAYRQSYFEGTAFNRFRLFFDALSKALVEKIESRSVAAGQLAVVHTGVRSKAGQKAVVSTRREGPTWRAGLISGSEIERYAVHYAGHYINIDAGRLWAGGWDAQVVGHDKVLLRQTGDSLVAAFDDSGYYHLNNLHSVVPSAGARYDLKYILALLNSKLLNHYYHLVSLELGRAMAQTDIETIEKLPIRRIDFDDPADVARHDRLVALVEEMLQLHTECAGACRNDGDVERRIERLDTQIDALVCELYEVTEEEIQVTGTF
jgi:adenine-specific DNA-methyltransferase